ncbi:MAG TPA: hypothetical protein VF812_19500 [Ktedonobacterales bacterium]
MGQRRVNADLIHNDGERITVYINRRYTRQHAGLILFLMALSVLAASSGYVLPPDPYEPVDRQGGALIFLSIACLLAIWAVVYLVQSMKRSPTLIVNANGITVYRSNLGSRTGLLPWHEIAWVGNEIMTGPSFFRQALIINLFQFPNASARIPSDETPTPTALYPATTTVVRIREEMLDIPVGELIYEIERYITTRAPAGWHGELSDELHDHVRMIEPPSDSTVA